MGNIIWVRVPYDPPDTYTPSPKFPAVLRKVRKRAKAIHPRQDKVVRLLHAEHVKTGNMPALETKFPGGNNTERKRKA